MKKDELIITFILTAILLAGSAFHFYNLGGKDAEVIYVRGDSTPFDAMEPVEPEVIPTVSTDVVSDAISQNIPVPMINPVGQNPNISMQQKAVLQWLNHASAIDFQAISGIGKQTAANIISYRNQHNGFRSINQLTQVNGIGDKRVEDIVAYIQQSFKGKPAIFQRIMSDNNSNEQEKTLTKPISINQANSEQLQSVLGIGPHIAKLIIDERSKRSGGFRSWNQLRNISGLGASRIELLQQHFTLE